jgi:hypothetical protein
MSTTYRVPGAILTEREHSVPLDYARPGARGGPTGCSSLKRFLKSLLVGRISSFALSLLREADDRV